jgi:uncharacterized protein (TIGR02996 family)
MTERDALLRAVCENPDDDTPRLVFADWLQENGEEARAEFIRVQVALAGGTQDPKLEVREQELLDAHREKWEPPFRDILVEEGSRSIVFGVHFRRGFPWALSVNDEESWFVDYAAFVLKLVPIERINFFHKSQHADLARCPELLRVRELLIDRAGFETEEIASLLHSKYLTNIVRLDLIADDDNGHLALDGLDLLCRTKVLPSLRHLDLSYNWEGWTYSDERSNWVRHLTSEKLIGQLETLRLASTDCTDECAQTLAQCKRASSLRHLDLSRNSIGEVGLRALATSRKLSSLVTLDLRGNRYESEQGEDIEGCPQDIRQLLEDRFGSGLLLDGKPDLHPIDEWFKQCQ